VSCVRVAPGVPVGEAKTMVNIVLAFDFP